MPEIPVEKRFADEKFGVFLQGSAEERNLSANELGANYVLNDKSNADAGIPDLTTITMTDVDRERKRLGGTPTRRTLVTEEEIRTMITALGTNIKDEFDIPVKLVGVGEKLEDLEDFSPGDFVDALFE